jgi:hypothetical protein
MRPAAGSRETSVTLGPEIVVAYDRKRHTVRLRAGGPDATAAEIPVGELLERLDVDRARLVPSRRYLLFAGLDGTEGGLSDLAGVFGDEREARAAFTAARVHTQPRLDWAELASVDAAGNIEVLCWFGHDRPGPRRWFPLEPAAGPAPDGAGRRSRRRLWRRRAVALAGTLPG